MPSTPPSAVASRRPVRLRLRSPRRPAVAPRPVRTPVRAALDPMQRWLDLCA